MKLANKPTDKPNPSRTRIPPPIALERPEKVELQKGEYLQLKLKSVPSEENSQTYELCIPYFSAGTPEQWFKFNRDLERVFDGQGLTNGPSRYAMTRRLLEGDALTKFNEEAVLAGNETVDNHKTVMRAVAEHVLPKRAIAYQKRYMRRFMRKPQSMRIRLFVARVLELNAYLTQFPPFGANQSIEQDELMDLFEFAIPAKWRNHAMMQGFDILAHTPNEFVEFCERLELVEETNPDERSPKRLKADADQDKTGTQKGSKTGKSGKIGKTCLLHGPGHSTDECKVLAQQAKNMKDTYAAQTPDGKKKWKKREEVNALVRAVVDELRDKKRKRKQEEIPEEQEVHLTEEDFATLALSDSDSD